ncbi:hypothetical protein C5167_028759 [Papaver somniferum]|uniref:F-box protein CPR1-like n=1 Tax=Papaver somniferum TaxID=3469 RepID=UPI000E6FD629|nr:F-box protein CPR1-like [Papaver somniferum]RZC90922.1 hypothetical protein C5167_028759 [Papaver somniferum]
MNGNNKQEPLPTFPEDIIVEILSRLPLRFLLQSRCVCKPWSILPNNNPKLIQVKKSSFSLMLIDGERRLLSLDNNSLSSSLFDGIDGRVKKIRCPLISLDCDLKNVNFVGSCNGLFFLYREEIDHFFSWNPCLWNPSTHEFKYLPRPGFPVNETRCILHRGHGFGYDAKSDDYKCVRIFHYSAESHSHIHMYSFRSNTWELRYMPYALTTEDECFRAPNGVFCNGALHWFTHGVKVLIAINMTGEGIREIPQPEGVENFGNRRHIDVLDGYLCILNSSFFTAYEVWLMKDYGMRESWTKVYNIPRLTLELEAQTYVYMKKIECLKTGEVLLEVQYGYTKTAALVLYDPKNETAKYLKLYKNFGDYSILRSVSYRYVKSLVRLNSDSHVKDNKLKDDQLRALSIRD